jgi:hypothetical protein
MATGLLEIQGTLDVAQHWPKGDSEADTSKVIVHPWAVAGRLKRGGIAAGSDGGLRAVGSGLLAKERRRIGVNLRSGAGLRSWPSRKGRTHGSMARAVHRPRVALALLLLAVPGALAAQVIRFDRTRVDFSPPDIMVGKASHEILIRVANAGTAPLKILQVKTGGPNDGDFRVGRCGGSPSAVLAPGARCDIQVGFVPTAAGARSAAVVVDSDDPAQGRVTIPLTGNGLAPAPRLYLSPPSLDFGVQPQGTPGAPQQVTVRNVGMLPLNVSAVTTSGGDFPLSQNCTQSPMASGGLCWIDVQFAPSSGGPRADTLTISSDDPHTPARLDLLGVGAAPAISASPLSLNAGSAEIGSSLNAHATLVLSNTGNAPLSITGVAITGAQAADFSAGSASCTSQPLPAGSTCSVTVTLNPRASGPRAATVSVTSNALGAPTTLVPVHGFGEFVLPAVPSPPAADDHRFVTAASTTVCSGNGATIPITVSVGRALGVGGAGSAMAAGTLSATATLELMVWDPGSTGQHAVSVNRSPIGSFSAQAGGWRLRSLSLPTGLLLFPDRALPGSLPTPAPNEIEIRPDTTNVGLCAVVAWARVSFLAMSPVILVHGNANNGGFFLRQMPSFVSALDAAGIPNDSSINLGLPAPVADDAVALQSRIPPIVRSFGVDSVHVVAHSKGGLDTRAWLSLFAPTNAVATAPSPRFRVLSVTTLATPHLGSALADLQLAIEATSVGLFGIPFATVPTFAAGSNAGTPDLTTFACAAFDPPLPAGVDYRMLGGDTDLNADGAITSVPPPDEYAGARIESSDLSAIAASPPVTVGGMTITGAQIADSVVTALYVVLRNTRAVVVTTAAIPIPIPIPPFFLVVTVTHPMPIRGLPAPNDLLVTIPSANGAPPPFTLAFPPATFTGAAGRNHGSVGDGGVAAAVIPLLWATDARIGDFR